MLQGSKKEAESQAWATVNKQDVGGKMTGTLSGIVIRGATERDNGRGCRIVSLLQFVA